MWWLCNRCVSKTEVIALFSSAACISMFKMYPDRDSHIFTSTHFIFFGLLCSEFKATSPWDHGSIQWQLLSWAVNRWNFCNRYLYTACILKSLSESCVCWLLSLKVQALQIASNWFLLSVGGKWVWKPRNQLTSSFSCCPFWLVPQKLPAPETSSLLWV
jgi:hypothetical protein